MPDLLNNNQVDKINIEDKFQWFDVSLLYEEIISHFWKCHDPTQLNRQGADIGTQYRSAIYYYSKEQKNIAQNSKNELQKKISKPIVTEITKAIEFYLAEKYHQSFIHKKNRD